MTLYQTEQRKLSNQERRLIVAMLPYLDAYTAEYAEEQVARVTGIYYDQHRDAVIQFIIHKRNLYDGIVGTRYPQRKKEQEALNG